MGTGSKGGSRINVKGQGRLLIAGKRLLPGRNHQNVIDSELVEELLPIVHPVDILCFFNGHGAVTDHIAVLAQLLYFGLDSCLDFLRSFLLIIDQKVSILCLFHKEAKDCASIVLFSLRQDVHEHLLFFCCSQRNMVLNLRSIQADVLHGAHQNIFGCRRCSHAKAHPFHSVSPAAGRDP